MQQKHDRSDRRTCQVKPMSEKYENKIRQKFKPNMNFFSCGLYCMPNGATNRSGRRACQIQPIKSINARRTLRQFQIRQNVKPTKCKITFTYSSFQFKYSTQETYRFRYTCTNVKKKTFWSRI